MAEISSNPPNNSNNYLLTNLPKRYSVSQVIVNSRIEALNLEPHKDGKKLYLNSGQLALMDELDAHLKGGGEIDEFVCEQIAQGRIVDSAPDAEAIILSPPEEAVVKSEQLPQESAEEITFVIPSQNTIADLQEQRQIKITEADFAEATARAQNRATAKLIVEDTLVVVFETSEDLMVPRLKEQLQQHRKMLKESRSNRGIANAVSDFLSQILTLQRMPGGNGMNASSTSKSNPSTT